MVPADGDRSLWFWKIFLKAKYLSTSLTYRCSPPFSFSRLLSQTALTIPSPSPSAWLWSDTSQIISIVRFNDINTANIMLMWSKTSDLSLHTFSNVIRSFRVKALECIKHLRVIHGRCMFRSMQLKKAIFKAFNPSVCFFFFGFQLPLLESVYFCFVLLC